MLCGTLRLIRFTPLGSDPSQNLRDFDLQFARLCLKDCPPRLFLLTEGPGGYDLFGNPRWTIPLFWCIIFQNSPLIFSPSIFSANGGRAAAFFPASDDCTLNRPLPPFPPPFPDSGNFRFHPLTGSRFPLPLPASLRPTPPQDFLAFLAKKIGNLFTPPLPEIVPLGLFTFAAPPFSLRIHSVRFGHRSFEHSSKNPPPLTTSCFFGVSMDFSRPCIRF